MSVIMLHTWRLLLTKDEKSLRDIIMEMFALKQIFMCYAYLGIRKVELMRWYCANGYYEIVSLICIFISFISYEFGIKEK